MTTSTIDLISGKHFLFKDDFSGGIISGDTGQYLKTNVFNQYTGDTTPLLSKASAGVISETLNINRVGVDSLEFEPCDILIWNNPNKIGNLELYSISGTTILIPTGSTYYIVVNYNNGSPRYEIISDPQIINESNILPITTAFRLRGLVYYIHWDSLGNGLANKLHERFVRTDRFKREFGLDLSTGVDRSFTVSSGRAWVGAVKLDLDEFKSTGTTNTFSAFLYHINGEWNYVTGATQFNITQYDDGNNLQLLGNNNYGVNWIYRLVTDASLGVFVLGNGDYKSIAEAEASQPPPNLPTILSSHGILVGRIIVEKNIPTPISIQSAFEKTFQPSVIIDHGSMDGLLDDDHPQYALLNGRVGDTLNVNSININGGLKLRLTEVNSPIYSGTTEDVIIGVNYSLSGETNIYLPQISVIGNITYIIKDQGLNSTINKINIIPYDGDLIDKNSGIIMNSDGMSITIYNNNINEWFII